MFILHLRSKAVTDDRGILFEGYIIEIQSIRIADEEGLTNILKINKLTITEIYE